MIHLKTVTLCGSPLNLEFKERYYQFSIIWKLLLLSTGIAIYMWVDFTRCGSYWRRRGQISAFNYCKNLYRLLQCLPCIKQNIYECIGLNCEWWNQTQAVNTMSSALILSMNINNYFRGTISFGTSKTDERVIPPKSNSPDLVKVHYSVRIISVLQK